MSATNFFFEARIRHFARAEHLNLAALQAEIRRFLVGVKVVTRPNDAIVEAREIFQQIARALSRAVYWYRRTAVAAGPVVCPIEAPVQRTHHAVIVHRREPGLPVVHPLSVARGHVSSRNTATGPGLANPDGSMAQFQHSAVSTQHSAVF